MDSKLGRPLPGRRVHFVAIGGVGMAAIAELLHELGYEVSGSDMKSSRTVERLLELGVPVVVGQHRASSVSGADHVIMSNAIRPDNVEVVAASDAGVEVLPRAELLGRILDAGRGIAVSGTHGKTTTSSMLARALQVAGFDPSFLIGGDLNDVGSGAALGGSDIVVAEADEAFGSFLQLRPELALVTNVDADHLDYYEDQDAIDDAFVTFFSNRRAGGPAVVCADDPGIQRILGRIAPPVVTYGTTGADLTVSPGGAVTWHGNATGELQLAMPGRHNLLNAAGALAAALVLGADPASVLDGLRTFTGVERRFSVRGEAAGVTVVDDYAHNPQKVAATLAAARDAYPGRRVVALFQPHLFTRTLYLADVFGASFGDADVTIVTDVYGAREEAIPGVSGRLIVDAIQARSPDKTVFFVPRLEEAAGIVAGLAEPGDVILTLGAGDVTSAAPRILDLLAAGEPRSRESGHVSTVEIARRLREAAVGQVTESASLAPFTTFRVGGPADILLDAESIDDLRALAEVRGDLDVAIVGRGSNLLVSDDGFRGIAVRLGRAFRVHDETRDGLQLGGAVYLPAAARLTARVGRTGFEFAAEIPATFGGAVRMNAGAHNRCMADVLVDADVVDLRDGSVRTVGVNDLRYAYRTSSLGADDIVTGGRLHLERDDGKAVGKRIAEYLRWRREHQPGGRSAGSVFKNPDGDSAGRLIDAVGAKGSRIGGAQVSELHANFIVADAGARADDVWRLITMVHARVLDATGVDLESEVRFLGRFGQAAS